MNMTGRAADKPSPLGSYFFLSYAHSPPLAGTVRDTADPWVKQFYHDLAEAVQHLSGPRPGLESGFFDQMIPLRANWKEALAKGLSTAAVFVPLYSPNYFAWAWPGKEWESFRRRTAGLSRQPEKLVPVLWIPVPGNPDRPGLGDALAIGEGESAYAENGLRAMLRLAPYRKSYKRIVGRIAARIVDLAETDPLDASPVQDLDEVPSAFHPEGSTAVFTVAVAAPSQASVPPGANPAAYGTTAAEWRPFPDDQAQPLAQYAATIAEQLNFAVEILEFDVPDAGRIEEALRDNPAVILIDPWFVAEDQAADLLRALVNKLRSWALPLLVLPSAHARRSDQLARRASTILSEAPAPRSKPAEQAIDGVSSLEDFHTLMWSLVAEAERQYLRHGLFMRTTGSEPRPRLSGRDSHSEQPMRPHPTEDEFDD